MLYWVDYYFGTLYPLFLVLEDFCELVVEILYVLFVHFFMGFFIKVEYRKLILVKDNNKFV